jgi:hypothetical protein
MPHYPIDARPESKVRPYRVTAYSIHWYWGNVTKCFVVGDYKYYWQANLVSWWYHHLLGYGCNTWRHEKEASDERQAGI